MCRHTVLLVILLCYDYLFVGTVQSYRSLSKEVDVDVEIHRKLLNKPSMKTIHVKSTMVHYKASERVSRTNSKSFDPYLRPESRPVGTISIQRIPKYLIRERETTNRPNTYLAIARSKIGHGKYLGVGGFIRVDNPKVFGQQYSATRISLQAGTDRIEAGWKVDPSLYGDSRTHFFIRTDAGRTHCFNIRCRGFIQTSQHFNFSEPLEPISIRGGPIYGVDIHIIKDFKKGTWNLLAGKNHDLIGYWPLHIFRRLAGFADQVEWGGEVYSPPGTPLPPMGSGNQPVGNKNLDSFIRLMKVLNEKGQTIDASNLETYANNSKFYSVLDDGYSGTSWGSLIFYGGPGHQ